MTRKWISFGRISRNCFPPANNYSIEVICVYIAPCDIVILRSKEVSDLKAVYQQKFDEPFAQFNYADYPGDKNQCAAQMYLDTLRKAVEANSPYRIVSHRYDEFDH